MKLFKITACFNPELEPNQIQNIDFQLYDAKTKQILEIPVIGPSQADIEKTQAATECSSITLDDDEFINSADVDYTDSQVQAFAVITNKGAYNSWGQATGDTDVKRW